MPRRNLKPPSKTRTSTGDAEIIRRLTSAGRRTEIATLARDLLIAFCSVGGLSAIPKGEGMRGFVRAARDFYGELDHATPWPKEKVTKKVEGSSDEDDQDADADIAMLDDD